MRGKGDGKNDYLKGNRTNSPRNPEKIQALPEKYSEEVKAYKAFAEARRSMRKWTQETLGDVYKRVQAYMDDCCASKTPMTVAGTILATGVDRNTWDKAGKGEMDYLLEEYVELNTIAEEDIIYDDVGNPWHNRGQDLRPVILIPWSEVRQKADLMIQAQLERNCYTNRGNPAGSIFGLKAQFKWREDESPQHLVQQLVVADAEQAKKMLEMLQ